MTAASAAASLTTPAPAPSNSPPRPCSLESLQALRSAYEAFAAAPLDDANWERVQRTVETLAPTDADFAADLAATRRQQSEKHGGFSQRYVLSKDVGPEGTVRLLPRQIPVRDDTRNKLARLVRDNPSKFPGGIQELLNTERPLQQAKSAEYAKLIAATLTLELDSLLKCDRLKLLKSSATLLDLLQTFRQMQRVAAAHPKVIETIDRNDTTAMTEFLVTVATRTPLTESELTRMVTLAAEGWKGASDRDLIVRGRVLQSGLEAKTALMKTWVEPFAAEVVFRGLLTDLQAGFRKRLAATAVAPASEPRVAPAPVASPRVVPATGGTFSAPLRPLASATPAPVATPAPRAPAASLSDTAPVGVSMADTFKIPIGVPEPDRLQVLRNYLRVSSTATVIRLSEAMRMSEARDDVVGHRLYVQRVFQEEGWAIIGHTRGDPMFSRLSTATAPAAAAQ